MLHAVILIALILVPFTSDGTQRPNKPLAAPSTFAQKDYDQKPGDEHHSFFVHVLKNNKTGKSTVAVVHNDSVHPDVHKANEKHLKELFDEGPSSRTRSKTKKRVHIITQDQAFGMKHKRVDPNMSFKELSELAVKHGLKHTK